jgi:hypothetical protein
LVKLTNTLDVSILRTCYQSKNFENLQKLNRKPLMNTLERLSTANFKIAGVEKSECVFINLMTDERGLKR